MMIRMRGRIQVNMMLPLHYYESDSILDLIMYTLQVAVDDNRYVYACSFMNHPAELAVVLTGVLQNRVLHLST